MKKYDIGFTEDTPTIAGNMISKWIKRGTMEQTLEGFKLSIDQGADKPHEYITIEATEGL